MKCKLTLRAFPPTTPAAARVMKKHVDQIVADMDRRHQDAALHAYKAAFRTFRDPREAFNLAKVVLAEKRPDLPKEELSLALRLLLQYHGLAQCDAPET